MHQRRPQCFLIIVMLLLLVGCDDVARVAARQADEAAKASRVADDFGRAISVAGDSAASRAASRIDGIADDFAVDDAREPLETLAWDVACDIVTGNIPSSTDDITSWIAGRAIDFGLEFSGDGAQLVAEAILASTDSREETSDAAEACSRLPDSGL